MFQPGINKITLKNNIYLNYQSQAGYGILNLIRVSEQAIHETDGVKLIRTIFPQYGKPKKNEGIQSQFKYLIKGTDIEQTIGVESLETLDQQDLLT